ncbi:hypothetical protein B0T10DRAFT_406286 [Thelonectria olida]|uniref:CMP/dCMP-type deaminase domain-containing protein n=1 Tax=Thelonectria olida TaxID=1576542 RepID=A0A9P8W2N6_9HYPO|nr:hypothetical protein B0T10DRAFT_406286 [Thelonectria olida]
MGMFKSLGLSPAKRAGTATSKAFRRLFGRGSSAGDGEGAAASQTGSPDDEQADSSYSENTHNNHVDNPDAESRGSNQRDEATLATDDNALSSRHSLSSLNIQPTESENKTDTHTTTETMAASPSLQHPGKENRPPSTDNITSLLSGLSLGKDPAPAEKPVPAPAPPPIFSDPAVVAERAMHMKFTEGALDMARLALKTNETPVGCVIVHKGKVIARGMNATNVTRNGTRHAEFMALAALLSYPPKGGPRTTCLKPKVDSNNISPEASDASSTNSHPPDEGNEDGSKGHLYPYGQKWHLDERVDRSIIRECILYVTVEPCVMCASLLRQLGIKKVYFGAVNDKFGGTGGVFSIHANSIPVSPDGQTASAHPTPPPTQLPDGSGTLGVSFPPGGGDGGNIESGYEIEGGWGRDDAVALLRRFYVQENGRAPVPRKKEGRAARLAALMEKDNDSQMDLTAGDSAQVGEQVDLPTSTDVLAAPEDVFKDRVNTLNGQSNLQQVTKNGELENPLAVGQV